ncbi:hypothetical protein DFQ26_009582 [Actinomortierella ambigua]|nr:hypothetical protein DFQ26_009582 [Actinomortierella ambigua]
MKSVIVSALLLVPAVVVVKAAEFVNCNAGQQSIIKSAAEQATSLVAASSQYLDGLKLNTERYQTWFGEYMPYRTLPVSSAFRRLAENGFDRFTYDCSPSSCKEGSTDPGEVDLSRFGKIQLCSSFWDLPPTG